MSGRSTDHIRLHIRRWWAAAAGAIAFSVCVAGTAMAEEPKPATQPDKAPVAENVKKLGDSSWRAREDAQKDLIDSGGAAVEELEKALKSEDTEVRQRAESTLEAIRKNLREGSSQAIAKNRLWKSSVKAGVGSPVAAAGGTVCFMGINGTLRAVDANGKPKWVLDDVVKERAANRQVTSYGTPTYAAPRIADGVVYVSSQTGRVYAVDLDSGEVKWKSASADGFTWPEVAGGVVYVGGTDKGVFAINAATGKQVWRAELAGGATVRPVLIGPTLYVAGRDGSIYAFDANSGQGKTLASGMGGVTDLVATADGGLVARAAEAIVSLDLSTGKPKWTYPVPGASAMPQVVMLQALVVRQQNAPGNSSPRHQGEDSVIVAGDCLCLSVYQEVHAVDAATGKQKWVYKPEAKADDAAANGAAGANMQGVVVMGGQGRVILRGRNVIGFGGAGAMSVPCIEGTTMYVADAAGLHAIDVKTRQELWRLESGIISARPTVIDGILYYGTNGPQAAGGGAVVMINVAGPAGQAQAPQADQPKQAQADDSEPALHAIRLKAPPAAK